MFVRDFDYYRERVAQEDARARRTVGTEAELVHRTLAALYARRAIEALAQKAGNDAEPVVQRSA